MGGDHFFQEQFDFCRIRRRVEIETDHRVLPRNLLTLSLQSTSLPVDQAHDAFFHLGRRTCHAVD